MEDTQEIMEFFSRENKVVTLHAAYKTFKKHENTFDMDFIRALTRNNDEMMGKLRYILDYVSVFYGVAKDSFMDMDDNFFYVLDRYNYFHFDFEQHNNQFALTTRDERTEFLTRLKNIPEAMMGRLRTKSIKALKNDVDAIHTKICAYNADLAALRKKFDDIKDQWKLSFFSGNFGTIAKEERSSKWKWLLASAVSYAIAVICILYNIYTLFFSSEHIGLYDVIASLMVTIFFSLSAYWFSKRYYVCRTQEISYRHLATILKAYDEIKDSSDGEERRIVMTEMAHTIFSHPHLPNVKEIDNAEWGKVLDIINLTLKKP